MAAAVAGRAILSRSSSARALRRALPGFPGPRSVPSLGTGFVISADGYIVTNNHVIEDVDKIEVHFIDGATLTRRSSGATPGPTWP